MDQLTQACQQYDAAREKSPILEEQRALQTHIKPDVEKLRRDAEPLLAALRSAAATAAAQHQAAQARGVVSGDLIRLLTEGDRLVQALPESFRHTLAQLDNLAPLENFPNVRRQLHNCLPGLRATVGRLTELAGAIQREAATLPERIRNAAPSSVAVVIPPERGPAGPAVETEFEMGGRVMGRRRGE